MRRVRAVEKAVAGRPGGAYARGVRERKFLSFDPASDNGSPPDEQSAPAAEVPARRPPQLSILLAVIFALNVLGMIKGLTGREQLMRDIPRLTPALFSVWLLAPPLAIAGALGLWKLRRWGLYLLGLGWVVAVVVDVIVGATNHAFLATGIMWLVVLFVRPVRAALK